MIWGVSKAMICTCSHQLRSVAGRTLLLARLQGVARTAAAPLRETKGDISALGGVVVLEVVVLWLVVFWVAVLWVAALWVVW